MRYGIELESAINPAAPRIGRQLQPAALRAHVTSTTVTVPTDQKLWAMLTYASGSGLWRSLTNGVAIPSKAPSPRLEKMTQGTRNQKLLLRAATVIPNPIIAMLTPTVWRFPMRTAIAPLVSRVASIAMLLKTCSVPAMPIPPSSSGKSRSAPMSTRTSGITREQHAYPMFA